MSTKVKGEAIKEGSIPLSALADDVKKEIEGKYGLIGYIGTLNSNTTNLDTEQFYGGSLYIVYSIKIVELRIGEHSLSSIFGGPDAILKIYNKNGTMSVQLQDSTGGYWKNLKVYTSYKAPSTATPDWNAQKGEPGYIENKPFGVEFNPVNWFYDDNYVNWCLTPMISNKVKYEGVIYEIPDNDEENVSLGDGSIALAKYPYHSSNLMHVVCYGINDTTDERLQNILFEVNTKLDEQYLSDTVIKTTPQTLSDGEKNQVLNNLGIKSEYQRYKEYGEAIGLEIGDRLFTNETSYYKYKTAKEQFGCTYKSSPLSYDHYNETVSFETYGITWGHIVALFEGIADWGYVSEAYDGHMWANIYSDDGEFVLNIDIINETVLNEGR